MLYYIISVMNEKRGPFRKPEVNLTRADITNVFVKHRFWLNRNFIFEVIYVICHLSFFFFFVLSMFQSFVSSPRVSPAFLSFLFLYTDRMTRTLPRMSTTMVKISTLASAVDNPGDALSPQLLSFRDKHFELFSYWSSKSISPHGAVVILGEWRVQWSGGRQNNGISPRRRKHSDWVYERLDVELLKAQVHTPPPSAQR